jgi:hypothetical protein
MQTRSYYGAVFDSYWTGETGRALQAAGGVDATLLGLYLLSNRHANMIGLYELPPALMTRETPISEAGVLHALDVLQAVDFAAYDAASAVVWVYTMARVRLGLTPERPALIYGDKRIVTVNRLYAGLVENPFLEPFYERNRAALNLNRLRRATGTPKQLTLDALLTETETETGRPTENRPCGNVEKSAPRPRRRLQGPKPEQLTFRSFAIYTVIARDAIAKARSDATVDDVTRRFKELCSERRIGCTSDLAVRAILAALSDRRVG